MIELKSPVNPEEVKKLRAGDAVKITGVIYTGRDAAHKRLCELLEKNEKLPIDVNNTCIYFVGPWLYKTMHKLKTKTKVIISIVLLVLFITDAGVCQIHPHYGDFISNDPSIQKND